MTSDPTLALALGTPPVLLWAGLLALLTRCRRPGALPAALVAGAAANLYPLLELAGGRPPAWLLAPCLAVAVAVGYGYMLVQLRRRPAAVVNRPRPADPRDQKPSERFRVVAARLNLAPVDAVATDETETR